MIIKKCYLYDKTLKCKSIINIHNTFIRIHHLKHIIYLKKIRAFINYTRSIYP